MHVLRRVCSWWLSTMKAEGRSMLRSEISDARGLSPMRNHANRFGRLALPVSSLGYLGTKGDHC